MDIDTETRQYAATALWCTSDESYNTTAGLSSDCSLESAGFTVDDIAPEALKAMREDVADFIHHADTRALDCWEAELGEGQLGHDFWLTRNGHGAGFWDRFMAEPEASYGRHLTDKAKPYGESSLWVDSDDGKVYVER